MADIIELAAAVNTAAKAKSDALAAMIAAQTALNAAQYYLDHGLEPDVQALRNRALRDRDEKKAAFEAKFAAMSTASTNLDAAKTAVNQFMLGIGVGTGSEL